MNVVIYARYSSHGQNEQSIEGQLKECREYAQRNNYTIIAEYIDRAKTGTKDSREQFLKMIEDSKQKKFTGVLVYQLDRFARNKYDSAIYKKQLKDRGIRVLSAKENITNDPAGMMLETVLEGMAEYYSLELSQKIIRGRKINNEHNYFNGGTVTFGYVTKEIDSPFCDAHGNPIKKKVIEIDDINGRIVTQIFLDVYNGMKFKDVIEKLKKQGVKTARGGYFDKSSLYRLLRNKKYITIRTYNGEDHLDFYPRLVSDEVFYGVQERLEKNKHKFDRLSKEEYLLVSKIFCGNCGNQYVGTSGTSKTKVVHKYYICAGKKNKSCNSKRIKKDFIEDIVINNARKVLTPDNINRIATTVVSLVEKEKNNSKIGQLNRALKQVEKKKSNIVNAIAECDNSNIRKTLYEELSKLEDQYSLLESDIANEENMSNVLSKTNIKHFLNQLKNGNVNDIKYKKSLIATLIKSVYVYEDKIVIFFNNTNEKMEITFDKVNEVKEFLCGNTCSTKYVNVRTFKSSFFHKNKGKNMYKIYIKKDSDTKSFLEEVLKIYGYSKKDIVYNEFRKPFIKDNKIYFSVSHDKNLIVIVVSDKCIGIDLQFLTYNEKVLKKAYTEKEIEILKQSNNHLYDFTKMWTMKEAYVKYLGKGLTYDFKSIETSNIINDYAFIETKDYIIAIYSK